MSKELQEPQNELSRLEYLSRVRLFATPWTIQSIEFSRQEYWSGWPHPSPGDLPDPGTDPLSLKSPALTSGFFTTSAIWEAPNKYVPGNCK